MTETISGSKTKILSPSAATDEAAEEDAEHTAEVIVQRESDLIMPPEEQLTAPPTSPDASDSEVEKVTQLPVSPWLVVARNRRFCLTIKTRNFLLRCLDVRF